MSDPRAENLSSQTKARETRIRSTHAACIKLRNIRGVGSLHGCLVPPPPGAAPAVCNSATEAFESYRVLCRWPPAASLAIAIDRSAPACQSPAGRSQSYSEPCRRHLTAVADTPLNAFGIR